MEAHKPPMKYTIRPQDLTTNLQEKPGEKQHVK